MAGKVEPQSPRSREIPLGTSAVMLRNPEKQKRAISKSQKNVIQTTTENALFDHPQNQDFREQSLRNEIKRRQKFGRGSKLSPAFRKPEPPLINLSPDPNKRIET